MLRIEFGKVAAWAVGAALLLPLCVKAMYPAPQRPAESATAGLDALKAAIGEPRCRTDAACWAVPVGARPCGGPETYWPASRETSDPKHVTRLAEAWAATQRERAQASGRMGVCTVTPMPAMRCNAQTQRCEAVPAEGVVAR